MDPHSFDALTRSLASAKTRRSFLGSIAALGAGLLGARGAAGAQARCANVSCKNNPGKCGSSCVCCVYGNGNSRCLAPGDCSGTPTCPPGQAPNPVSGCVAPTTTTTTTEPPCVPESNAAACLRTGVACGPTTNNCGQAVVSCGTCNSGQTCCGGTCSDCPCDQIRLCNGSCATLCSGDAACPGCSCIMDVSGESYCSFSDVDMACISNCDCPPGQFCGLDNRCLPLCRPA